MILYNLNRSWLSWENKMDIIKDDRKNELYRILKNLEFLAERDNWGDYLKLRKIFNNLLHDVFGKEHPSDGTEGFEWDKARGIMDTAYTYKGFLAKDEYEISKRDLLKETSIRIKKIKTYL